MSTELDLFDAQVAHVFSLGGVSAPMRAQRDRLPERGAGLTVEEISKRSQNSRETIRSHVKAITQALGVSTQHQIVAHILHRIRP